MYQPKTGVPCYCRKGVQRDNCITCEGTGQRIDFQAIRDHCKGVICKCNRLDFKNLKADNIIREVKYYPVEGALNKTRAETTGEFRYPKKGEYYLSGSIPMAYKALNDLTTKYYICSLVKTKLVEVKI